MSAARERTLEAQGKQSAESAGVAVRFNGNIYSVDVREFTLRENSVRTQALKAAGLPLDDTWLNVGSAVWAVIRRTDPDIKLDEVLDGLTVGDWLDAQPVEDDDPSS